MCWHGFAAAVLAVALQGTVATKHQLMRRIGGQDGAPSVPRSRGSEMHTIIVGSMGVEMPLHETGVFIKQPMIPLATQLPPSAAWAATQFPSSATAFGVMPAMPTTAFPGAAIAPTAVLPMTVPPALAMSPALQAMPPGTTFAAAFSTVGPMADNVTATQASTAPQGVLEMNLSFKFMLAVLIIAVFVLVVVYYCWRVKSAQTTRMSAADPQREGQRRYGRSLTAPSRGKLRADSHSEGNGSMNGMEGDRTASSNGDRTASSNNPGPQAAASSYRDRRSKERSPSTIRDREMPLQQSAPTPSRPPEQSRTSDENQF